MNTVNLGLGVNFHFIRADKFKTSVICVLVRSKLNRETATTTALIPAILKSGSHKYQTRASISAAAEAMYGAVFDIQVLKKGEEQIIQFYIEFVNYMEDISLCDAALEFVRELMLNPLLENGGFLSKYIDCEKQNLKTAIEGRINIKTEYAKLKCLEHMCEDESFGIYADGYTEDLGNIDGQSVYMRYMELLREAPIEFIVLGNGDEQQYHKRIEHFFMSELSDRSPSAFIIPRAAFRAVNRPERRVSENIDITQGKLCMGFRAGIDPLSEEFISLMVFNELLGGMANSRLFCEAREKHGLCYYINSFIYRFKSILFVQSGVETKSFDDTIGLITEQINQIAAGKINDDELADAKKSLETTYSRIGDNQGQQIDFHFAQYILGDSIDADEIIRRVQNVSKQSCSNAAKCLRLDTVYTLY